MRVPGRAEAAGSRILVSMQSSVGGDMRGTATVEADKNSSDLDSQRSMESIPEPQGSEVQQILSSLKAAAVAGVEDSSSGEGGGGAGRSKHVAEVQWASEQTGDIKTSSSSSSSSSGDTITSDNSTTARFEELLFRDFPFGRSSSEIDDGGSITSSNSSRHDGATLIDASMVFGRSYGLTGEGPGATDVTDDVSAASVGVGASNHATISGDRAGSGSGDRGDLGYEQEIEQMWVNFYQGQVPRRMPKALIFPTCSNASRESSWPMA